MNAPSAFVLPPSGETAANAPGETPTIVMPAAWRAIAICWFGTGRPRESCRVPVMAARRVACSGKSVFGASSPMPTETTRAAAEFETPGKYVGA